MGMIMCLMRVTEAELDSFLKDSQLLEDAIYRNESEEGEAQKRTIDLDKSWDGILYLLNGEGMADAGAGLSRLLLSGDLIDEGQDLGYGPAHFLRAKEAKHWFSKISTWTEADLRQRYDSEDMASKDLYPTTIWDEQDFEYLVDKFVVLQQFYQEVVRRGDAVITTIS